MPRSLRLGLILAALLLGAQIAQAMHIHADALAHADCISCQLHADQKLLPAPAAASTAIAKPGIPLTCRHIVTPLTPLAAPHNRGPPAFS